MKAVCDDIDTRSGETALLREAAERIRDMDRALRAHISNMTVKGLPSFIALSRHQFELASFVNERRGRRTEKPVTFLLKDHATGESRPMTIEREPEREVSDEEREMFDDISWRAHALNGVLDDFQKKLTVNNFGELIELSNHQCELVDYLSTGKFRKAPRRRKARTLGTEGVTPESQERIEALGEALNEYQGRIEIKNLREFIALSKHQCELAGMMADYLWGGRKKNERLEARIILNLVHYSDEFEAARGDTHHRDTETQRQSTACITAKNRKYQEDKTKNSKVSSDSGRSLCLSDSKTAGSGLCPEPHISDRQQVQGLELPAPHQRFSNNEISGSSLPVSGYKLELAKDKEKTSHPSTIPLYVPNRAMPKSINPKTTAKSAPVKVKTFPVLIEGTVCTGSGEPEPLGVVRGGIRSGMVKHFYNAGTDRDGRFSKSIAIETSPIEAQRVQVWGKAVNRRYDMPLPFAQLRVKVSSDGFTRTFACEANGNGEFSRTFEREEDDGFP